MKQQDKDSNDMQYYPDLAEADGLDEDIDISDLSEEKVVKPIERNTRREIEDYLEAKRIKNLISDDFDDWDVQ